MNNSELFVVYPNKGLRTIISKNCESKRSKAKNPNFHLIFRYVQLCGYITTAQHVQVSAYS